MAPTAFGQGGLFGGGERYPLELARAVAAVRGVDCELLTFGPEPSVVDEPTGLRIRVLRPLGHLRGHPAHPVAARMLREVRWADVVHTHHLRATPSRIAAIAARVRLPGRRRTPVAVTDHGLTGGDWFGVLPRLVDRFLPVSEHSADVLRAPADRTRVVWGGVDATRFTPEPRGDRDGVLFVGRLTPHKGIDRLVEALPDGATLTIVGTGGHDPQPPESGYVDDLRALAQGRDVRFTGPVDDAELPSLYRRAAVVAMPSVNVTRYGRVHPVSELLGLTALEAMASATPVVASRIGGLAEVVVDGVTGHLVEPGDVDALRNRIAELLADPPRARRMGVAGRERALAQFTWDACAQRCVAAYRELVS